MKYDALTPPVQCIMTNSTCYCSTYRMSVKGIIIHSIPYKKLKKYVQPSPSDPNKEQLLELIGINKDFNDLNHTPHNYGVNAWIGELQDGTIGSLQTLPWDYRSWGCGLGPKGTCNDGWIQIAICQNDKKKESILEELKELISYLCKLYNINPYGTIKSDVFDSVPTILFHDEGYKLGYCQRQDTWLSSLDLEDFKLKVCRKAKITANTQQEILVPTTDMKVEVQVKKLNVRAGPGMNYIRVGALKGNEIVRIVDRKNGFGKLKHNIEGWIDLQYTREVK